MPDSRTGLGDADAALAAIFVPEQLTPVVDYLLSDISFSFAGDVELNRRIDAFAASMTDYHATLGSAGGLVPPHIATYLRSSLRGPQLGYYLAKHPDLLNEITCAYPPVRGVATLLNLELQFRHQEVLLYSNQYCCVPSQAQEQAAARLLQLSAWEPGNSPRS